jgi:DNA-binding transcriptional ArsR family regulator
VQRKVDEMARDWRHSRTNDCKAEEFKLRVVDYRVLYEFDVGYKTSVMTGFDCIAALKALGEETRLRILRLLFKEPLSVNEISERLEVSQYNVSKHLRVMREAGLLEIEKQGQQRLYAVPEELKSHVAANDNVLDLGCCTFRLDKLPK